MHRQATIEHKHEMVIELPLYADKTDKFTGGGRDELDQSVTPVYGSPVSGGSVSNLTRVVPLGTSGDEIGIFRPPRPSYLEGVHHMLEIESIANDSSGGCLTSRANGGANRSASIGGAAGNGSRSRGSSFALPSRRQHSYELSHATVGTISVTRDTEVKVEEEEPPRKESIPEINKNPLYGNGNGTVESGPASAVSGDKEKVSNNHPVNQHKRSSLLKKRHSNGYDDEVDSHRGRGKAGSSRGSNNGGANKPVLRRMPSLQRQRSVREELMNLNGPQAHKDLIRVLIVDESSMTRHMVTRLMRWRCSLCDEAANGVEALNKVKALIANHDQPYDVILMDMVLPQMNGPETARHIRKLGYKGAIIGVTACMMPVEIELFRESGADRVLAKPLDVKLLERCFIGERGSPVVRL